MFTESIVTAFGAVFVPAVLLVDHRLYGICFPPAPCQSFKREQIQPHAIVKTLPNRFMRILLHWGAVMAMSFDQPKRRGISLVSQYSRLLVLAIFVVLPRIVSAADKSGVSANSISLPKGPGSIEGLGESFQPTLNTGTAKYGISFKLIPGTAGMTPSLALSYDAGGGNGPYGWGWSLRLPSIQRQTDKGIPLYGDPLGGVLGRQDRFINEDREELVPVAGGAFFCKNEGAFIRYRQVGDHWEAHRPDGTLLVFGSSKESRITDESHAEHIFEWLLESESDTHGNTIVYHYASYTGAGDINQKYLAGIDYGQGKPPWSAFHFVRLRYEKRPEVIEDARAGFVIRTGHRLAEVLIGSQGVQLPEIHAVGDRNDDGLPDALVRRYVMEYLPEVQVPSQGSYLHRVQQLGSDGTAELPPLSLDYLVSTLPTTISASRRWILSTNAPPTLMDVGNADFVDLNGDGRPDILRTVGDGASQLPHEAWLNRGIGPNGVVWERLEMSGDPQTFALGLQTNVTHLADMDGDGLADFVLRGDSGQVRYFPNGSKAIWRAARPMAVADFPPPAPFGEPNVRVADMDFDKRSDIIRSLAGGEGYQFWLNLGGGNYSPMLTQTSEGVVDFGFEDPTTDLADFNGDRVPDLVRIRPGGVSVALGLGYGRFAPSRYFPIDDLPDSEAARLRGRLIDITSDGLADLVIERAVQGEVWYWVNLGQRGFDIRRKITDLPIPESSSVAVRWADINGNGTSDLVYAESQAGSRLVAVDVSELIGCGVGHGLLGGISNGIGRVTHIDYRPSTEFRLEDEQLGKPWPNPVPLSVPVVSQVETSDSLGHRYRAKFQYHDGFYDAEEKQFRGFARVEQLDVGDTSAPTLVSRSYFDTGKEYQVMKGKLLRLTVETEGGRQFSDEATGWRTPPVTLHQGIDDRAIAYVHPTNSVRVVKELGQGLERRLESEVEYDLYGNQTISRNFGVVENGDRRAWNDERVVTTEYAINTNRWLLREPMRQEVRDLDGHVISRSESYYDDESFSGNNLGEVTLGNLTMKRDWIWPATNSAYITSARTKYDTYGNPVAILDPLAVAPAGNVDLGKGHAREIAYDPEFHTYPIRETIHLGDGKDPLIFQAAYDPGFGTVTSSTDFNGNQTTYDYDTFARLTSIVRPYDTTDYSTAEYSYVLAVPYHGSNLVNYVETRQLDKIPGTAGDHRGHYFISRQFVDGLGRKLLSKQEAGALTDGGPPRVTVKEAVTFNARMKPSRVLNPFYSRLKGSLDDQLAYESIEDLGWSGEFQLNGSLVTLNLSNAHASTTEYDATLREVKSINPDGTFRRTVYEPLLTRSYDENDTDPDSPYFDTPMVHYNDGLGRLIQVDEISHLNDDGTPAGALKTWTTRYDYDLNDQLTHITDSQNNQKWMQYDGLKRKTFMNDPDRGVMTFAFDEASNLIETTDAKNQRITYTYDGANRIRSEDYHDEGQPFSANFVFNPALPISPANRPDVAYFYDVAQTDLDVGDGSVATAANVRGKLAYVWDLAGEEHTSYDARDRVGWVVKRVRDPIHGQLVSFRTAFAYDSLDRITGLTYPDNDGIGYQYNDRSLLARIQGGQAGVLTQEGFILSGLRYWPSDQQAEIRYGNGIRTAYAYDERLRLKTLNTAPQAAPASPLIAFGYEFDGVSNIRRIDDQRPGSVVPAGDPRRNTQLFQYDDLYRLTRAQYSFALPGQGDRNDGEITYRYDRIGNMLAQLSTLNHVEKGLPVANLGEMDSGGSSGRWNRKGRVANDPPGPHALTAIRHSPLATRLYPYDPNGNMTSLDGMLATWDFKDRLVRLEDTNMVANYTYDFTDRRITKKVFWKHGEPTEGTNQPVILNPQPATTSVTYVGKHFEVREHEAPTKYVFNGNTRVARVTGTLMPGNLRVQRLRVATGWNLVSLAVTTTNAAQQLSTFPATGGEVVQTVFKWRPDTRAFAAVSPTETLPAGTVLWIKAAANATLRVLGGYDGPPPSIRAPPEGDLLPGTGLEVWPTSAFNLQPSALTLWAFSPDRQNWQTKFAPPLTPFSDFPPVLAVGQAFYGSAPAPVELEQPPGGLSLRYYHQDHLGSSSVLSDARGQRVEEAANYPFGATRNQNRLCGVQEAYQFTQKERDNESGLDYFEARFLANCLARFTRVDPLAATVKAHWIAQPQRWNPYAYSGNDPLRNIDPTGLDFWEDAGSFAWGAAKGVAIGAGVAVVAVAAAPVIAAVAAAGTVGAAVVAVGGVAVGATGGYMLGKSSVEIATGRELNWKLQETGRTLSRGERFEMAGSLVGGVGGGAVGARIGTTALRAFASSAQNVRNLGEGLISVTHPNYPDASILGQVSGDALHIENVNVPFNLQGRGLSSDLYKLLVKAAGNIKTITGELMHTNERMMMDAIGEGFSPQAAASMTKAASARASAGFTRHSFDEMSGILTSSKE